MQVRSKLSVLPDVLSMLVVVALMGVTYLCSQPQAVHSFSHHHANTAELISLAQ